MRHFPPALLFHLTAAAILLSVLFRPIYDTDLPWQVKAGELVLDAGRLPDREPFLADKADEPFVPVAWAGQVVYAAVRRLGGWPLLHVADGLLWVGGLMAVGHSARKSEASVWAAVGAVALANLVAFSSVSTRPQTFALTSFGLLIALVRSERPGWLRIALGAVLLVAWQNLHPSAAVGAVWLGGAAVGGWVRRFIAGSPSPWAATGLALLAPAALLATPAGADLLWVSRYNADVSRWFGISEWLPLWELDPVRGEVWTGLVVTAGLLAWRGNRVRLCDLLPALVLLVMAILSYRFVMFWAVAMVPVWASVGARSVSEGLCRKTLAHASGSERRTLLFVLPAWVVAVAVPWSWNPSHLADHYPFTTVGRLKTEQPTGTIYCNAFWGGVLIDANSPGWRVTHDGRYYLRSKDEWTAYFAASAGDVPISELEKRHAPVAFVLRVGFDDGLIARLRHEPGWRELPPDGECVVFVRDRPTVDAGPPPR